jgi:hypothetical protein
VRSGDRHIVVHTEDIDAIMLLERRTLYMVEKMMVSAAGPAGPTTGADTRTPEVAGLLGKVEKLLEKGQPAAALELLGRSRLRSPWLTNAAAVCQLRLGNADAAVEAYRGLVLTGGLFLRQDAPDVFKINFATALIAVGNLSGGLRTLGEVRDEAHPAVLEIRDAVRRWRGGMTFWQWLWWSLGGSPPRSLVLDFHLGRL